MSRTSTREEALFADALAQPPAQRRLFLAQACGADAAMLAGIATSIAAHEGPESLMVPAPPRADLPPAASANADLSAPGLAKVVPSAADLAKAEEKPGDTIGLSTVGSAKAGRYKLLQKVGEGGCGVEWMAEQEEPMRRRGALKVIKLGMDKKAIVARFEAERQALVVPGYSFGMPHAPAAMSRRFMSGVTRTAPSAFRRRRRAGKVFASFLISDGFRRTIVCLTCIVFVMRLEVFDGMIESLVESHVRQPALFTQVPGGGEQVLMSSSVRRVEAGKNTIAAARASHQPHEEGDDLPLNRGELHRDVSMLSEPDDERFVPHVSTRTRRVNCRRPIPSASRTQIRGLRSVRDGSASRRIVGFES